MQPRRRDGLGAEPNPPGVVGIDRAHERAVAEPVRRPADELDPDVVPILEDDRGGPGRRIDLPDLGRPLVARLHEDREGRPIRPLHARQVLERLAIPLDLDARAGRDVHDPQPSRPRSGSRPAGTARRAGGRRDPSAPRSTRSGPGARPRGRRRCASRPATTSTLGVAPSPRTRRTPPVRTTRPDRRRPRASARRRRDHERTARRQRRRQRPIRRARAGGRPEHPPSGSPPRRPRRGPRPAGARPRRNTPSWRSCRPRRR